MASKWLRISLFGGGSTSLRVGKWLPPQTITFVGLAHGHGCARMLVACSRVQGPLETLPGGRTITESE